MLGIDRSPIPAYHRFMKIDLVPIHCEEVGELIIYVGTEIRPPSQNDIRDVIRHFGGAFAAMQSSNLIHAHVTSVRSRLRFYKSQQLEATGSTEETLAADVMAELARDPKVIVVVRLGDDDFPASSEEINLIMEMLQAEPPPGMRVLVTHHGIRIVAGGSW